MNIADTTYAPTRARQAKTFDGQCFCGAVQFTVSGEPAAMGYCHCESCRHWSAGPVNAFTLWKPEALEFVRGADKVDTYNKTPKSYRKSCRECGGHLYTDHPGMGLIDVYAAIIPDLEFQPGDRGRPRRLVLLYLDELCQRPRHPRLLRRRPSSRPPRSP